MKRYLRLVLAIPNDATARAVAESLPLDGTFRGARITGMAVGDLLTEQDASEEGSDDDGEFGLAVIPEIAMVLFGLVWLFDSSITPGTLLAALPAWQLALGCAVLSIVLRLWHPAAQTGVDQSVT